MIHEQVVEEMPASCETVFDLVHDYARRLEWDTLLRAAFVEGGAAAGTGAVAVCRGRWWVGGLSFRTVYVSFERGRVAAVEMLNRPPLFERWAASIRHEPLDERKSRLVYTYHFRARPAGSRSCSSRSSRACSAGKRAAGCGLSALCSRAGAAQLADQSGA